MNKIIENEMFTKSFYNIVNPIKYFCTCCYVLYIKRRYYSIITLLLYIHMYNYKIQFRFTNITRAMKEKEL